MQGRSDPAEVICVTIGEYPFAAILAIDGAELGGIGLLREAFDIQHGRGVK